MISLLVEHKPNGSKINYLFIEFTLLFSYVWTKMSSAVFTQLWTMRWKLFGEEKVL